jgi:hypothetical protein
LSQYLAQNGQLLLPTVELIASGQMAVEEFMDGRGPAAETAPNVMESPHAGVRLRTGRVTRWKDRAMVLRWAATAFLATETNFRRIIGYQEFWPLRAVLDDDATQTKVDAA